MILIDMKEFLAGWVRLPFSAYCYNEKLSTLSREISWSNNVLIMMAAKTDEEQEFYLEALDSDVKNKMKIQVLA